MNFNFLFLTQFNLMIIASCADTESNKASMQFTSTKSYQENSSSDDILAILIKEYKEEKSQNKQVNPESGDSKYKDVLSSVVSLKTSEQVKTTEIGENNEVIVEKKKSGIKKCFNRFLKIFKGTKANSKDESISQENISSKKIKKEKKTRISQKDAEYKTANNLKYDLTSNVKSHEEFANVLYPITDKNIDIEGIITYTTSPTNPSIIRIKYPPKHEADSEIKN